MVTTPLATLADLDSVLQRHQHNPTRLLQILIDAQDLQQAGREIGRAHV